MYSMAPALILARIVGSDWNGVRSATASASASAPSISAEVDAPVWRLMRNSSPRACSSLARSASAVGTAFG